MTLSEKMKLKKNKSKPFYPSKKNEEIEKSSKGQS